MLRCKQDPVRPGSDCRHPHDAGRLSCRRQLHALARKVRPAAPNRMDRAGAEILLKALLEGPAMRQQLHQQECDVRERAGMGMLSYPTQ